MTAEMRGPIRIPHGTTYRDVDLPTGTCEQPQHFGSDLWILDGNTDTTPANSQAARLCRDCPLADTCPIQSDKNPAQWLGTIRGAKAYFWRDRPGQPFKNCARHACHNLFASSNDARAYCSTTCKRKVEAERRRTAA